MRDIVILMRRHEHGPRVSDVPLDERAVSLEELERVQAQLRSHGFELHDVLTSLGMFAVVVLCRAESIDSVGGLLNELADEWHTDALLATSHLRYAVIDSGVQPSH